MMLMCVYVCEMCMHGEAMNCGQWGMQVYVLLMSGWQRMGGVCGLVAAPQTEKKKNRAV